MFGEPFCNHLMIRVPSEAATAAEKVRRMCAQPGCDRDELLDPDSDLLVWRGPWYGKAYL